MTAFFLRWLPAGAAARTLAAAALFMPFIAIYAHKGMAVVAALATVLCLADRRVRKSLAGIRPEPLLVLVGLVPAFGLVSSLWAVNAWNSILLSGQILLVLAEATVLLLASRTFDDDDGHRLRSFIVAGAGLLVVVLGIENLTDGAIIKPLLYAHMHGDDHLPKLNPGNAVLLIFTWPLVFVIARHYSRPVWIGFLAIVAVVLASAHFSAAVVALALSAPIVVGALLVPRLTALGLGVAVAVWGLAMPWTADWLFEVRTQMFHLLGGGNNPMVHRIFIWDFVVDRIGERPLLGWGLNSSRAIPGGHENILGPGVEALPLHPHNIFLQIWLEMGLIGAVLVATLVVVAASRSARAGGGRLSTAAQLGVLAVFLVVGQVSFSVWSVWWLSATILAMSFAGIPGPPKGEG